MLENRARSNRILAILLLSTVPLVQSQSYSCTANCVECYGPSSNYCVASCPDGTTADTYDSICKSTSYDTDTPCLPGTYNGSPMATDKDNCKACDPGKYCTTYGNSQTTNQCALGYYCTQNNTYAKPMPDLLTTSELPSEFKVFTGGFCVPGQYCPAKAVTPIDCDPGYYCPYHLQYEVDKINNKCRAGFYCSGGAKIPNPTDGITGNICPTGKYCPEGSSNPIPCSVGTFLSYQGASAKTECQACSPGQYCGSQGLDATSGDCSAGYYCLSGQSSATPIQYYCPIGSYCPQGSVQPMKCPVGQFTSTQLASTCSDCLEGKYCTEKNIAQECDIGNYCPTGDFKIHCPLGTYSPSIGLTKESQCLACPKGKSCQTTGLRSSSSNCAAGYVCEGSAISPKPNDATQGGRMCKPGYVCPSGSYTENKSSKGRYQPDYAASYATALCEEGYYCPEGEAIKNKYICTPGYYCDGGSSAPTQCPKGTYTLSVGASSIDHCQECPGGMYCDQLGLITPSFNCKEGYYCPNGQTDQDPIQYLCPIGYACPEKSIYPTQCSPGYYQPATGKATCDDCPEGFYCEGFGVTSATSCELGYYCPKNTQNKDQYPCPAGTYNPNAETKDISGCLQCPQGYFCDRLAQTTYYGKVFAGYYSNILGNQKPDPLLCPKHAYCEEGSVLPTPCDQGYMTVSWGSTQAADCVKCQRGHYCKFNLYFASLADISDYNQNLAEIDWSYYGLCLDGYICLEGSYTSTPTDATLGIGYICPVGYYCTSGAYDKRPCLPGTYNEYEGQHQCSACPAGYYCEDFAATDKVICPKGMYCPEGSASPQPCKPGTYNNVTGLTAESECTLCDSTMYCEGYGLTEVSGLCADGYICGSGSSSQNPYEIVAQAGKNTNGICPAGYYCKSGDLKPTVCPTGTYNDDYGGVDCKLCPPGKYCQTTGLISPTGDCQLGYFCEWGEAAAAPIGKQCNGTFGYCPKGAVANYSCPFGYLLNENKGICDPCPDGYQCRDNIVKIICPAQHFCNESIKYPLGRLCPNGTYSNKTGLKNADQCGTCPVGMFCLGGFTVDNCTAGYICNYGANSPTPVKSTGAYPCPRGYYCPKGAQAVEVCPVGTYTFREAAMSIDFCDYCQAGYYCSYGSIEPTDCPEGNYCPIGSQEPTNCTVTRYNPYNLGKSFADCQACKGGYYCNSTGLGNLFSYGATYKCPYGNYCPLGTWRPYPCKAGSYADETLRLPPSTPAECVTCPEHYYCPTQTAFRYSYPCPSGTYCPAGSAYPKLCPPGKYCKPTLVKNQTVISVVTCPVDHYCPLGTGEPIKCFKAKGEICNLGSSFPSNTKTDASLCGPGFYFGYGKCLLCEPGYVCVGNTNTKYPVSVAKEGGYECPIGNYCPSGSTSPTKCPKGTFRQTPLGKSIADCFDCPSGSYNTLLGQSNCIKCGRGSNSSADFSVCRCTGQFRIWRLSDNQCVCQSPYTEPQLVNDEAQTSKDIQDCVPPVSKVCGTDMHFDQVQALCISNNVCSEASLCNGEGSTAGYYSSSQQKCMCSNVDSQISSYCDDTCISKSVKALLTNTSMICLTDGTTKKYFNQSDFGTSLFLDGVTCTGASECLITGVQNSDGSMGGSYEALPIFVQKWKSIFPKYVSPYGTTVSSSTKIRRFLQSNSSQLIESSIICIKPNIPVSFSVSKTHFPVYVSTSLYNTNPSFDYGLFDTVKTKLLNAGMDISTFFFTFSQEGVYVFGDYADLYNSQTIIKVDDQCPATKNIYPMTEENLQLLNIKPQELKLTKMNEGLIAIPVVFIFLTFVSTAVQKHIENKILKKELERRLKRAGRRRNFHNEDGKLDKKQYLADLYKLIKDNLEEVKKLIDSHDSKDSLYKLLKDKTSLAKELGDDSKNVIEQLKDQLGKLLGDMRFPDGRALKEVLAERLLQRRLHEDDETNHDGEDEGIQHLNDSLDRPESAYDEDEEEEEVNLLQMNTQEELIDAAGQGLMDDEDHRKELQRIKSQNQMDQDQINNMLRLKKEQEKRKNQFKERVGDMDIDQDDKDNLMEGFDSKMLQLDNLIKNESKNQDSSLEDKLAARRARKNALKDQISDRVQAKQDRLDQLVEDQDRMIEEFDDIMQNGVNQTQLKEISDKEKAKALSNLERQMEEKLSAVRDEYMERMKNARSSDEKERILDEMHNRLQNIEEQLRKEKAEQERNLDKILKERQARRIKKMAKEQDKMIGEKGKEIQDLQRDIEKEKALIYAENGGKDAEETVNDTIKQKIADILKKVDKKQQALELDQNDKDAMEIFKVQLGLEKEKALNNVERELEEQSDDDRYKIEQELNLKLQKQRDDYANKIKAATSQEERTKLMKESDKMQRKIQEEINNEQLKQERMLEEKKMNRQSRRKIKEMEIDASHLSKIAEKEMELLNKKFNKQDQEQEKVFDQELQNTVNKMQNQKDGKSEQALIMVNEAGDDMLKKRLKMLINKQFFELQKYLGALYTQSAMDKLIAKEKIKEKYKVLEEEAYATLSNDKLQARLNSLKEEQHLELGMVDMQIDKDEKEKEADLREKLENKFSQEKQSLYQQDLNKKQNLLEQIIENNQDDELVQQVGQQLIENTKQNTQEELQKLEQERQDNIDRIKLQIVAENEAELQDMQKKIEEQMNKEKDAVENRMKQKRDEVIGDKKRKLEEKINEMKGTLSDYQREMIMKQYQKELDALERAIAMERDNQLQKMRQKLIKRKIERERLKKDEESKSKMDSLKTKLRAQIKNQIKSDRTELNNKQPGLVSQVPQKEIKTQRPSTAAQQSQSLKDKLKRMLAKWNNHKDAAKQDLDDIQNIWEKNSQADSMKSNITKMSLMSKFSKVTGMSKATGAFGGLGNNLASQNNQVQNFTMEELIRRVRRIEKLTEKMSEHGPPTVVLKQAQSEISKVSKVIKNGRNL
eukprot:403354701